MFESAMCPKGWYLEHWIPSLCCHFIGWYSAISSFRIIPLGGRAWMAEDDQEQVFEGYTCFQFWLECAASNLAGGQELLHAHTWWWTLHAHHDGLNCLWTSEPKLIFPPGRCLCRVFAHSNTNVTKTHWINLFLMDGPPNLTQEPQPKSLCPWECLSHSTLPLWASILP